MIDQSTEIQIDTAVLEAQFRTALDRVKNLKAERDLWERRYNSLRWASVALVMFLLCELMLSAAYIVWKMAR